MSTNDKTNFIMMMTAVVAHARMSNDGTSNWFSVLNNTSNQTEDAEHCVTTAETIADVLEKRGYL